MSQWTERSFLRDVRYRTDANLAARQSIYAYQQPPVDMVARVLDVVLRKAPMRPPCRSATGQPT